MTPLPPEQFSATVLPGVPAATPAAGSAQLPANRIACVAAFDLLATCWRSAGDLLVRQFGDNSLAEVRRTVYSILVSAPGTQRVCGS